MKQSKGRIFASFCLHLIGFALCILPPLFCVMKYFPLWKSVGIESCIAGGAAILIVLCIIPIIKLILKFFSEYTSFIMWLMLFLLFLSLSRIADEMTVISFVGFVGNLMGAVCHAVARWISPKKVEV